MSDNRPVSLSPDIATKAELNHLIENRATPSLEPHLKPDGPDAAAVDHQVNATAEKRIGHLQERLQALRDGAGRDYAFAQLQDRAKGDFERSR